MQSKLSIRVHTPILLGTLSSPTISQLPLAAHHDDLHPTCAQIDKTNASTVIPKIPTAKLYTPPMLNAARAYAAELAELEGPAAAVLAEPEATEPDGLEEPEAENRGTRRAYGGDVGCTAGAVCDTEYRNEIVRMMPR